MAKSDLAKQLFEPEKSMGVVEAAATRVDKGVGVALDGLGKLYEALTPFVEHGAHELAAASYTGSDFVMYAREGKEGNEADNGGVHGAAEKFDAMARDNSPPEPPAQEQGQEQGLGR